MTDALSTSQVALPATVDTRGLTGRLHRLTATSLRPSVTTPLHLPTRWLDSLRRVVRFGAVGASGTVLNLGVMAVLLHLGVHYVIAAIVATELSILSNVALQERYVFADRREGTTRWHRCSRSIAFNNVEALARLPFLVLLVEVAGLAELLAQAVTIALAFTLRFQFLSRVVYRATAGTGR